MRRAPARDRTLPSPMVPMAQLSVRRMRAAAALLALLGACRDLPTTTAAGPAPPEPAAPKRAAFRCAVSVAALTFECRPDQGGGARGNLVVGGQGVNVRLVSSNTAYDAGTHVLSTQVTLQNLLDQPMGTNGVDSTGSRVFFNDGPNVTSGSGFVTVIADSMGTFLATNQPYYPYPGVIAPRGVSQAVPWSFDVQGAVGSFAFVVYVDTQLPGESSILHFRPERGTQVGTGAFNGTWAASAHDVFAVGSGVVAHFDGNYWRAMDAGPCACALYAAAGSSGSNVYAVGAGGSVLHWTGAAWDAVVDTAFGGGDLFGAWAGSASDVWVVGDFGTLVHWNGAGWTRFTASPAVAAPLNAVWGSGASDVWAAGGGGTVAHWNGSAWSAAVLDSAVTLYAVWGTSASDAWTAGYDAGAAQAHLYHWDGAAWSEVTDALIAGDALYAGWSGSATDVWIATAGGAVLHWNGGAWTATPVGPGAALFGVTGAGGSVFAVGDAGTLARDAGSGWTAATLQPDDVLGMWGSSPDEVWAAGGATLAHRDALGAWTSEVTPGAVNVRGVWGSAAGDVWAVGDFGSVLHFDGASWSVAYADSSASLNAAWGAAANDVWAAGDAGALVHWDGSAWTPSTAGSASLRALWGSSATDVYAVGDGGTILRWSGTAWSPMASGTAQDLRAVWGSGAGDVYAAGDAGTVLHYDGNPGGTWVAVSTPADPSTPVYALWGSGAADVFAAVNGGRDLMHWDGSAWRLLAPYASNAAISLRALWGTDSRNLYAGGTAGLILHGRR